MSSTPIQDPHGHLQSSDSDQTFPSRPLQHLSDPSASKRVCFYKSGDYTFSGHRMVVNARTFKTFDALLDALSKKVPLPFGVRTITTPRGTHPVKALDDLHDGGAYVCSDQKRVKPLNLEEVSRRQVPWNTTRPLSVGRLKQQRPRFSQFGRRNEAANRSVKVSERMAVRTPKRLLVIKNKDPMVKRTIVLQRRTAPTYDALLDYLSQILQFPVLKLYSTDGRRVDSLAALILCSGVVVAAGTEPFRLANYSSNRPGQMAPTGTYVEPVEPVELRTLQARSEKNKTLSNGRSSRNFSLSSERYIVNQINKSRNGSLNGRPNHNNRSLEAEFNQLHTSMDKYETGHRACIVPREDDIEKSFRVNQDGSMTVEMKVHLTIKEEEMLHWTTTLSRSMVSKRTVCSSISESGNSSFDSNHTIAKNSSSVSDGEAKEDNSTAGAEAGVGSKHEGMNEGFSSATLGKAKPSFKRTPTPGHRQVDKKASVESVRMVTESGVQESTLGHYSYMERTADGGTTEGYCVVRHSSNSNSKPIPKPRRAASAGTSNKCSNSSMRSSGVAEVLQIQNNGMEITETLMHIYETQGCHDNYFGNEECSVTPASGSKHSPNSRLQSSGNDCDIDCSWQPPTADSPQQHKEEMLSLSSEPAQVIPQMANNLSSQSPPQEDVDKDDIPKSVKKKIIRPARNQKTSTPTGSTDMISKSSKIKKKGDKSGKHSSTDRSSSDASIQKKRLNSSESGPRDKGAENKAAKIQLKKPGHDEKMPKSDSMILIRTENGKTNPSKRQSINIAVARENSHNVNTPFGRPQMKKNMSDILQAKKSTKTKTVGKTKSMTESKISPPKNSCELSESVSMPFLNPSPAEIHQYVENWLERHSQEPEPHSEAALTDERQSQTKVVFQIGGESESEEKNDNQSHLDVCHQSLCDTVSKSTSCLSVPLCHEWPGTALEPSEQKAHGLCVSMPSVRVDPEHLEAKLRLHKSVEAVCPDGNESSSSNILSPKAKLKPVLKQLCSSIQCIRRASDVSTTANLEKSNSLPDFPTQVASVFGSSCKAFLSFLSVMTLKDGLQSSAPPDGSPLRTTSEAMLMMESLQKISAIKDGEEQKASLSDLQNRTSSEFKERWRDFVTLQERLECEPLSPKVSETEFALDVVSEGSDVFEDQHLRINELMEEMDVPQDLRAEIASTIQQVKHFYPIEESTILETDRNESELGDVEHFVANEELPEVGNMCMDEVNVGTKHCIEDTNIDPFPRESNQEHDEPPKVQSQRNEQTNKERNEEGEVEDFTKYSDSEETFKTGKENEEEAEERKKELVEEQRQWDRQKSFVEESSEKEEEVEIMKDEEEVEEGGEKDESAEHGGPWASSSIEETDEREGAEETEEEDKVKDEADVRDGSGHSEAEDEEDETKEDFTEAGMENGVKVQEAAEGVSGGEAEARDGSDGRKKEEETDEYVGREVEKEADKGVEESIEESDEAEKEEVTDESEGDVRESTVDEEDIENVAEKEKEEGVAEADEEEKGELIDEEMELDGRKSTDKEDNMENVEKEEEVVWEADEEEKGEGIEYEGEVDVRESTEEEEGMEKFVEEEDGVGGSSEEEKEEVTDNENEVDVGESSEEEEDVEKVVEEEEGTEEEEEEQEAECEEEEDIEGAELKSRQENYDEASDQSKGLEETDQSVQEEVAEMVKVERTMEAGQNEEETESVVEQSDSEAKAGQVEKMDTGSSEGASGILRVGSQTEDLSEGQSEDGRGKEEEGEQQVCSSHSLSHPVEISQELLDFVNYALKSSSLIFTYDSQGNLRIEPDGTRVVQTEHMVIPESRQDSLYGMKCLPSPSTSDLSDYRPETSESGGYKSQDSVDVVSDSGDDCSQKPFMKTNIEQENSKSNSETFDATLRITGGSSGSDSNEALKNDLSYFSAASSSQADAESAPQAAHCIPVASEKNSADGVLIDQGRWLLKENHLIRKSPPVSLGMYSKVESTSTDTNPDNNGDDSPHPSHMQHNPLVAISSSELEEMAKPSTPKCTYYNMPHGSDSDPFLDDSSIQSGKKDSGCVKGRGTRVSPVLDTSRTWPNKNGSLSSFASVEFKIPDRKVHPEREALAVAQVRRTASGGEVTPGSQDSLEALHVRCGQYCPIL